MPLPFVGSLIQAHMIARLPSFGLVTRVIRPCVENPFVGQSMGKCLLFQFCRFPADLYLCSPRLRYFTGLGSALFVHLAVAVVGYTRNCSGVLMAS